MSEARMTITDVFEAAEFAPMDPMTKGNLEVSTWVNDKGVTHITLSRVGRYKKNIAVPAELVPAVIGALAGKLVEHINEVR